MNAPVALAPEGSEREKPAMGSEPDIVIGSREQLLHLLAEAAEIEHTLMCSYLYAAFSLRRSDEPGLTPSQADAVGRWRTAIMGVAIEEMGHLFGVANLTVAIGGRPHFGRPNFPISPGYFPSGVAVRLTRFDAETLKHFIYLERPQGMEGHDSSEFVQDDYTREQAVPGLMPSAQDYATIAHLYDAIRENLKILHRRLGDDVLFLGGVEGQVGCEVVELKGIRVIDGLDAALSVIDIIVEQGEGSPADRDESHYRSFLAIERELAELIAADPSFAPAWAAADNPVLRRPIDGTDRVFVEAPDASVMLDFACATYGMLLRCLVQSFGRTGVNRIADQKSLFGVALELMHLVGAAGDALARLPASEQPTAGNAGMSFTMLRSVEPLISGRVEQRLLLDGLRAVAATASQLGFDGCGISEAAQGLALST